MAKDDNAPLVDKDSREELEQVRKGKSRKFVMVCKGASIVSLVVYKKGSVDKFKKQAKEAGTGQAYHGVIDGRGLDLTFKLAIADGFEKEPVKAVVLKSFLEERAELKCKPTFEIVQSLPTTLDDDDHAPATSTGGTSTPSSTGNVPPAPPLPPDSEMTRFTARLKALKPGLEALITAATPAGAEAKKHAAEAASQAKQKDFAEANQALDRIEALLKRSGNGASAGAPPPPPPSPVTAPDRKLAASLRYLGPSLTQAVRAYPDRKAEIDKLKSAIEQCLKAQRIDEGQQVLAHLDKLLASLGSVDPEKADAFHEQWDAAIDAWETAVASVRDQLAGLQSYLVGSDDDDLQSIGEFGLGAVTQSHLVPLSAALMELDATGADRLKTAAKRVRNLVAAFRKHIETSPMVSACDENPFGVSVSIRRSLEPGFTALERGLEVVTAG